MCPVHTTLFFVVTGGAVPAIVDPIADRFQIYTAPDIWTDVSIWL